MTENAYLKEFLGSLRDRGLSPATIDARRGSLWDFLVFLRSEGVERVQETTPGRLDRYRLNLVERGLSPSTVDVRLRSVKAFFRFLEETGSVFADPARRLIVPRVPRRMGRVPSAGEIDAMLAAAAADDGPTAPRNLAILETAVSAGLRLAELTGLRLGNLDLERGFVGVAGKGGKDRVVPVGRKAVEALEAYLHVREEWAEGRVTDRLWLRRSGRALGPAGVAGVFKALSERAGVKRPVNSHAVRRFAATSLLRNGGNPVLIAETLGHSGLKTLAHYLRTNSADLKRTHQRSRLAR